MCKTERIKQLPAGESAFGDSIFEDFLLPEEIDLSTDRIQMIMTQVTLFNFNLGMENSIWN